MSEQLFVVSWAFFGDDEAQELVGSRRSCEDVYRLVLEDKGREAAFVRVIPAAHGIPVVDYRASAAKLTTGGEDE